MPAFDAVSHGQESYMIGTTFSLFVFFVPFHLYDVSLLDAAIQNKRREIPPRLAKSQWTTAPLSGLVRGLSSSAESSLIPGVYFSSIAFLALH